MNNLNDIPKTEAGKRPANPLGLLGISLRGGRLAVGEEACVQAMRAGKAKLLLTACDAAGNTLRQAVFWSGKTHTPHRPVPFTKAQLGAALGRASCAVAAVTDRGLALAVEKALGERI